MEAAELAAEIFGMYALYVWRQRRTMARQMGRKRG